MNLNKRDSGPACVSHGRMSIQASYLGDWPQRDIAMIVLSWTGEHAVTDHCTRYLVRESGLWSEKMVLWDIGERFSCCVWKRTCLPFPGAVVRQRQSRRNEALQWAMAGWAATVTIVVGLLHSLEDCIIPCTISQ